MTNFSYNRAFLAGHVKGILNAEIYVQNAVDVVNKVIWNNLT